jgi:hypothetical protein
LSTDDADFRRSNLPSLHPSANICAICGHGSRSYAANSATSSPQVFGSSCMILFNAGSARTAKSCSPVGTTESYSSLRDRQPSNVGQLWLSAASTKERLGDRRRKQGSVISVADRPCPTPERASACLTSARSRRGLRAQVGSSFVTSAALERPSTDINLTASFTVLVAVGPMCISAYGRASTCSPEAVLPRRVQPMRTFPARGRPSWRASSY